MRITVKQLNHLFALGLIVSAVLSAGSCAESIDHDNDDESLGKECAAQSWRNPSPDAVVCRGVSGCSCEQGLVCCVSSPATQSTAGHCCEVTACAEVAFQCDGPEDCTGGQVCCGIGYSTSCMEEGECFGANAFLLCRTNDDCRIGMQCIPAYPETWGEDIFAVCRY